MLVIPDPGSAVYSQNPPANKMILLDEKVRMQEEIIRRMQDETAQKEQLSATRMSELKYDIDKRVDQHKADTETLANNYLWFLTALIVVLAFMLNFFGKKTIESHLKSIIGETARQMTEQKIIETLNSTITNEVIEQAIRAKTEEEIYRIVSSIEQKGNHAINQIKTKGEELLSSMLTVPPKPKLRSDKKHLSDAEISNYNSGLMAQEFFGLALNSEDPRIQIELYKNVLKLDPNNVSALNNMAVSHNNLNETKEAIRRLNKALETDPGYYQALANRAQAYNLQNDFENGLKDIDKALTLKPDFEFAYAIKGNILTKQGQYKEAEIALNTAVEMNPNSPDAYYNRAFFFEEQHQFEKSGEDYRKAEALGFPNKAMLYTNMAVLFRRLKDFDTAIEFIEKARRFNPDYPNIDGTLALIYADKNDDENFYAHLKTALEKGCTAWDYLADPGFDRYRDTKKLQMLMEAYRKRYFG
jgi:tetratricopeptide (TPR) repeat protein